MPIDPRPRVEARGRLTRRVGLDRDHVLRAAELDARRDVEAEAHIAIRMLPDVRAVDIDIGVAHHTVELDENSAPSSARRQREMFPVPADSGGQIATAPSRGSILIERALDAPVMGHTERTPTGICEAGLIGARRITLVE